MNWLKVVYSGWRANQPNNGASGAQHCVQARFVDIMTLTMILIVLSPYILYLDVVLSEMFIPENILRAAILSIISGVWS